MYVDAMYAGNSYQGLEGLAGSIKAPDLDGGILASTEEQLSSLSQAQHRSLQSSTTHVKLLVQKGSLG